MKETSWKDMNDETVLYRAQTAIDENGFPDAESFARTYRGIAQQLRIRGLDFDELVFCSEPVRAGKASEVA